MSFAQPPTTSYSALMGQALFLHRRQAECGARVRTTVHSLAIEQNNSAVMIGACQALVSTLYYLGGFETARQYAIRGVQIWRLGGVQYNAEDLEAPAVVCL